MDRLSWVKGPLSRSSAAPAVMLAAASAAKQVAVSLMVLLLDGEMPPHRDSFHPFRYWLEKVAVLLEAPPMESCS